MAAGTVKGHDLERTSEVAGLRGLMSMGKARNKVLQRECGSIVCSIKREEREERVLRRIVKRVVSLVEDGERLHGRRMQRTQASPKRGL
jgi:hypothetical protein